MFSAEDEHLLAQPLPEPRTQALELAHFEGGHGVLEYREAGRADLPVLFLMHGIGSSSAGYRGQLAGLQDRYRLIAWNAPGFGRSTALADERPDWRCYVDAAAALLKALGVTRLAGLVGSSWGSVIATGFARSSGIPLDALILSAPNTARGIKQDAASRATARQAVIAAGLASFKLDRQVIADRLLASGAAPSVHAHTRQLRDAVTPHAWTQAMNMLFSIYTPKLLSEVPAFVSLIVGREDKVAPEDAHAALLRAARPDMRYYALQGVGHMPKLEAPATFNRIVHESIMSSAPSRG